MDAIDILADADADDLRNQVLALMSRVEALEMALIQVNKLSEISSDMGDLRAGRFIATSGNGVPEDADFSGTVMDTSGVRGLNSGVLQAEMSATNGKITAGAGNVILDADGINIQADTAYQDLNSVKFLDENGNLLGWIYALKAASPGAGHSISINSAENVNEPSSAFVIATGLSNTTLQASLQTICTDSPLNFASVNAVSGINQWVTIQGGKEFHVLIGITNLIDSIISNPNNVTASGYMDFNDDGRNIDFRFEGDNDQNLLFLDASADFVGIGTNSPATKLQVVGTVTASAFSGPMLMPVAIKSADYTLTTSDAVVVFTATATATLPMNPPVGQTYRIVCRAGTLTIDGNGATVKGEATQVLTGSEDDLILTFVATGVWE